MAFNMTHKKLSFWWMAKENKEYGLGYFDGTSICIGNGTTPEVVSGPIEAVSFY